MIPLLITLQAYYLEYEITPSISSEDLVEWVHNQSSDHSWAYHVYQLPSFRYEIGYWIWKDNTSKFSVSLYGDTSKCDVSRVNVFFPNLKMQAHKTYNIRIEINMSRLSLYVNGMLYNGTAYMQIWYANGTFDGWEPFNNGGELPGNFLLRPGTHGIFWNITGWDSEHLGSHPFNDFVIIQPSWQHSDAPMRAPIPNGAIALSLIIIITAITLMGDKK